MRALVTRISRRPLPEQRAGGWAWVLLAMARAGIHFLDVPTTRAVLRRVTPSPGLGTERLAQIVISAARALPGATTCLPRALVLEALLRAEGRAADLRIGLAPRAGAPKPEVHAWVELSGQAVAEDVSRYTAAPLFGARG